jgi:hypothetical protein
MIIFSSGPVTQQSNTQWIFCECCFIVLDFSVQRTVLIPLWFNVIKGYVYGAHSDILAFTTCIHQRYCCVLGSGGYDLWYHNGICSTQMEPEIFIIGRSQDQLYRPGYFLPCESNLIFQCIRLRNLLPSRGMLLLTKLMLFIICIYIMLHFDKNPMRGN